MINNPFYIQASEACSKWMRAHQACHQVSLMMLADHSA
jgi:hypothetical protein